MCLACRLMSEVFSMRSNEWAGGWLVLLHRETPPLSVYSSRSQLADRRTHRKSAERRLDLHIHVDSVCFYFNAPVWVWAIGHDSSRKTKFIIRSRSVTAHLFLSNWKFFSSVGEIRLQRREARKQEMNSEYQKKMISCRWNELSMQEDDFIWQEILK